MALHTPPMIFLAMMAHLVLVLLALILVHSGIVPQNAAHSVLGVVNFVTMAVLAIAILHLVVAGCHLFHAMMETDEKKAQAIQDKTMRIISYAAILSVVAAALRSLIA